MVIVALRVCHFPIGILGQVWHLIVSIPDLCTLTYFKLVLTLAISFHTDCFMTCFRLIMESLSAKSTQINFFIHNLAQMKFSSHAEGALLSFVPKVYK